LSEEEIRKKWNKNPMLKPRIEKVTANISVGTSGEPLERAATILKQLTDQQPCKRKAKKTIRDAVDNKLSNKSFDRYGNFSFGIKEHIEIPGTKYVPELGIYGMDVSVALGRPGYRVKRRHRTKSKIGVDHLLATGEALLFIKDEFEVEIV